MMEKNLTKNNLKNKGTFYLCAFVFMFIFSFFTACSKSNYVKLNMEYYTLNTSSYELITDNASKTTFSTDFISADKVFRQYDKITLSLSSEWLYLFYASSLSFDITTTHDCIDAENNNTTLQFEIIITNLAGGKIDGGYGAKVKTYSVVCEQKANNTKKYKLDINDYFEKSAETTAIIFKLSGTEAYAKNADFKFALNNISLYGDHSYIK